jgi:hypothetical protein
MTALEPDGASEGAERERELRALTTELTDEEDGEDGGARKGLLTEDDPTLRGLLAWGFAIKSWGSGSPGSSRALGFSPIGRSGITNPSGSTESPSQGKYTRSRVSARTSEEEDVVTT